MVTISVVTALVCGVGSVVVSVIPSEIIFFGLGVFSGIDGAAVTVSVTVSGDVGSVVVSVIDIDIYVVSEI